jgi:hypothetical protein
VLVGSYLNPYHSAVVVVIVTSSIRAADTKDVAGSPRMVVNSICFHKVLTSSTILVQIRNKMAASKRVSMVT